jgi:hypothetical protein
MTSLLHPLTLSLSHQGIYDEIRKSLLLFDRGASPSPSLLMGEEGG